jgi:hypothetical protein
MNTEKRKSEFDEPFESLNKKLKKFANEAGWKSTVPFILSWLKNNQPKDTPYTIDFWLKEMRFKK